MQTNCRILQNQISAKKRLNIRESGPNKLTYRPYVDWIWQLAPIVVNPYLRLDPSCIFLHVLDLLDFLDFLDLLDPSCIFFACARFSQVCTNSHIC